MKQTCPLILAADIGGTNTRVALLDGTDLRAGSVTRFVNAESGGLESILQSYLVGHDCSAPDAVSLALAGPIEGDKGRLTNLDWSITTSGASHAAGGAMGILLNDLSAQGHALPYLANTAFNTIQAGKPNAENTTSLMIGLGTGMNVAPVHRFETHTFVPASEAGHTSFAPQDDELIAFGTFLATRLGHVASEDILSGRGIERAYEHCAGTNLPSMEIMQLCANGDETALNAIGLLVRTLGHFTGDMALTHLPRGGIYLVGGVARALMPYFETHGFAACFADKGRFSEFMTQFSIHVVQDDYAALIGAASYAQECLNAR